jgi:hypothetical protein
LLLHYAVEVPSERALRRLADRRRPADVVPYPAPVEQPAVVTT